MIRRNSDIIAICLMLLTWVAVFLLWLFGRADLIYVPAAVGAPLALFLVRDAFSHSRASKIFIAFCIALAVVMQFSEMLSFTARGITTLLSVLACAAIAVHVLRSPRAVREDEG